MGMTMTQKILAAHAGLESVSAGQLIMASLDLVLGNDITSPVAIKEFARLGSDKVFDINKVTMVMDHFAPNKPSLRLFLAFAMIFSHLLPQRPPDSC